MQLRDGRVRPATCSFTGPAALRLLKAQSAFQAIIGSENSSLLLTTHGREAL